MALRDTAHDDESVGQPTAASYRADNAVLAAMPMRLELVQNAGPVQWPPYDEVIYSSPIDQIHTMPEMFQFKGGTDRDGISPHMRNVEVAEVAFGKVGFVWRSLKKKKFVADGHQRLGMFKRAGVSRQGNPLSFHYFRLDEANGWTMRKAMLFAAYTNIAEDGPTTKPMDVARLFRSMEEPVDINFLRKYLPARNRCLEQGLWLSRLGDEAFKLMDHPSAQPGWGVLVAQRVQLAGNAADQAKAAEMQSVLMETLIEARPSSDLETAQLVDMAIEAGFTTVEQLTLFGKTSVRETLIPQRFKIFREVDTLLKKRLGAVKTVSTDPQTRMTLRVGAEKKALLAATESLTWAQVLLKREANVKGDLSTELSALALRLKNKEISVAEAAEHMFAKVQGRVDEFRSANPSAVAEEQARVALTKRHGVGAADDCPVTRDLLAGVGTQADADAAPTFL